MYIERDKNFQCTFLQMHTLILKLYSWTQLYLNLVCKFWTYILDIEAITFNLKSEMDLTCNLSLAGQK